ncbi:MAG: hypothetical protein ACRD1R_15280 [Acidobacteriota bacterium]
MTKEPDLLSWFKEIGIQGILIGGAAASILRRPRVTRDVDALVLLEQGNGFSSRQRF